MPKVSKRVADRLAGHVLTLEEAAIYARLSVSSMRRYFASGKIPARKVGSLWRCRLDVLEKHFSGE